MKSGIHPFISNWDYHNNPKYNALSAGGIKSLLRSPAHFKASQANDSKTPALVFGSAAHSYILQPELGEVVVMPEINRRTKEGRQEYAAFMEANEKNIIVDAETIEKLKEMREIVMQHESARMLLEKGNPEQSVFWKNEKHDFLCKCRPDFLVEDIEVVVDYKTCVDASEDAFGKACVKFGYDIQAEWYKHGVERVTNGIWDFVFIAQEKTPPYAVAVYRTPVDMFRIGREKIDRAVKVYAECLRTGEWGAYPTEIQNIKLPGWAA